MLVKSSLDVELENSDDSHEPRTKGKYESKIYAAMNRCNVSEQTFLS